MFITRDCMHVYICIRVLIHTTHSCTWTCVTCVQKGVQQSALMIAVQSIVQSLFGEAIFK